MNIHDLNTGKDALFRSSSSSSRTSRPARARARARRGRARGRRPGARAGELRDLVVAVVKFAEPALYELPMGTPMTSQAAKAIRARFLDELDELPAEDAAARLLELGLDWWDKLGEAGR